MVPLTSIHLLLERLTFPSFSPSHGRRHSRSRRCLANYPHSHWLLLIYVFFVPFKIKVLIPNVSFMGHLSGIVSGTIQAHGGFDCLLPSVAASRRLDSLLLTLCPSYNSNSNSSYNSNSSGATSSLLLAERFVRCPDDALMRRESMRDLASSVCGTLAHGLRASARGGSSLLGNIYQRMGAAREEGSRWRGADGGSGGGGGSGSGPTYAFLGSDTSVGVSPTSGNEGSDGGGGDCDDTAPPSFVV